MKVLIISPPNTWHMPPPTSLPLPFPSPTVREELRDGESQEELAFTKDQLMGYYNFIDEIPEKRNLFGDVLSVVTT